MGSILSIIGIFILAALKLEQFVYGKSGKQQSTTGHVTRRGIANIAGLIAFDHAISSKSVVVRKKKGSLSNVGVFTLRVFFGTNHSYGWCHSFCSKVEYVL